mgnify:CR=1 FL=1
MTDTFKPIGWATTIKTVLSLPKEMWDTVMTVEKSPLKNLDPMVAHMIFQCLFFIWSGIFAVMIGSYLAFGISAAFHLLLISGVTITAVTFRQAEKNPEAVNKLFKLRPGYHSVSRTRQYMWMDGKKIKLDDTDPGGEHE